MEENYKLIKEKIGLTDFRGYSVNSIMQEFWISMLLANLALAVKKEADRIIDCSINRKGDKHILNYNRKIHTKLLTLLFKYVHFLDDCETLKPT